MKRKRAIVLVLAALMAATKVFPTSAYAVGTWDRYDQLYQDQGYAVEYLDY